MSDLIKVGITHGDFNGVGYEVIVKAILPEEITELFTPVVFGYPELIKKAAEAASEPGFDFKVIKDASEAEDGKVNIVSLPGNLPELTPGMPTEISGKSAVEALNMAVEALKTGDIDVLVTAPISKEAAQGKDFQFPGHTEFLEETLGDGDKALMILCNDKLRVALLTIHLPLAKVVEKVTVDRIVSTTETFAESLKKDFGIVRPSIAVLSLNPHAGDGGVIGSEEEEIIKPALEKLRENSILAFGPYAVDGFFGHGLYSRFDGILAMYHDQGLAPFKTIASSGGVNFTAGLPFVRTSPDHGTASDIAWKGIADPASMREAIYMAIDIFRRRNNFRQASANPLKKYMQEKPDKGERGTKNSIQ